MNGVYLPRTSTCVRCENAGQYLYASGKFGDAWKSEVIHDRYGQVHDLQDKVLPYFLEVGCPKLRAALDTRLHPKLHVFGHIHEGYGQLVDGPLTSVNASFLDHLYHPANAPVVTL